MNLDESIVNAIIKLAQKHGINEVILFGSRARGTNSINSDIDIAISGGDFYNFAVAVDNEIQTLLKFDVVNLDNNISSELKAEIKRDGVIILPAKHFTNFVKSLNVLKRANKSNAMSDEIYRMGVIGQFNLTFELAWKSVKDALQLHGVDIAKTGSPREILKAAYQINFLSDEKVWLDMLKCRNTIAHMYDENAAIELANKIFDDYLTAFINLHKMLDNKINAVEDTF